VADANDICTIVATNPNYGFNHKTMNADKLYAFYFFVLSLVQIKEPNLVKKNQNKFAITYL